MHAAEGTCFVLAPCAVVSQAMIDDLCDTPDRHGLDHVRGGHAVIDGPDGRPLVAKLPEHVEGILYADIDLGAIVLAKTATEPAGHDARPDVTRLFINRTRMRRAETFTLPIDVAEPVPAGLSAIPSPVSRRRPKGVALSCPKDSGLDPGSV